MALGCGVFVAAGDAGGRSKSTDLVGEGNGRFAGFRVLELSFALRFPISFGVVTSGEAAVFVFALTV